mmetsp:Transcript_24200/g.35489  ORF Transcript_24200/g.35489 Transcript_24200/m.35489 type:complete len:339 (+) Transcript_24200:1-1017(+)
MEVAAGVDVTSEEFLLLVRTSALSPQRGSVEAEDHLKELRQVMRQIAKLAKQDEQAARARRARIHRGILLRWNDLWHATAGLGWVTDNDVDAEEHLAPPTTALLDSLTDGTDRDSDGAPSRVTRCAAASGTVVAVTGGAKVLEQGGGKHSDPLLVAAANVADKMKEDVRAWQLKAEELLMPLTARGVNGGAAATASATASATAAAQSTKKAGRECAPEKGAHEQDSERVTHPASTSSSTMTSAKTASTRGTATGAAGAAHDACMQGTRASEAHAASVDAVSAHAPVDGEQGDAIHLISQVSPYIPHPGGQTPGGQTPGIHSPATICACNQGQGVDALD